MLNYKNQEVRDTIVPHNWIKSQAEVAGFGFISEEDNIISLTKGLIFIYLPAVLSTSEYEFEKRIWGTDVKQQISITTKESIKVKVSEKENIIIARYMLRGDHLLDFIATSEDCIITNTDTILAKVKYKNGKIFSIENIDKTIVLDKDEDKMETKNNLKFDWDLILQQNTVINCNTENKAKELLKEAHERGLKWCSDESYLDYNKWDEYMQNTCYCLSEGRHGSKPVCIEKNYTILSYDVVLLKNKRTNLNVVSIKDLKKAKKIKLKGKRWIKRNCKSYSNSWFYPEQHTYIEHKTLISLETTVIENFAIIEKSNDPYYQYISWNNHLFPLWLVDEIIEYKENKIKVEKFDWNKILQPETVVNCDTENKAIELLNEANERGLRWWDGSKYLKKDHWDYFSKETCYNFKTGGYADLTDFKGKLSTILSYEDALLNKNKDDIFNIKSNNQFSEENIKPGMKVKLKPEKELIKILEKYLMFFTDKDLKYFTGTLEISNISPHSFKTTNSIYVLPYEVIDSIIIEENTDKVFTRDDISVGDTITLHSKEWIEKNCEFDKGSNAYHIEYKGYINKQKLSYLKRIFTIHWGDSFYAYDNLNNRAIPYWLIKSVEKNTKQEKSEQPDLDILEENKLLKEKNKEQERIINNLESKIKELKNNNITESDKTIFCNKTNWHKHTLLIKLTKDKETTNE